MGQHYLVTQGPGKALEFITRLNELIDGDNIETEHFPEEGGQTNKGRVASLEMERLVKEMRKEDVLALLGSAGSLHHIVQKVEETLLGYVEERWGPGKVEWLR